jgi:hypothetical protein
MRRSTIPRLAAHQRRRASSRPDRIARVELRVVPTAASDGRKAALRADRRLFSACSWGDAGRWRAHMSRFCALPSSLLVGYLGCRRRWESSTEWPRPWLRDELATTRALPVPRAGGIAALGDGPRRHRRRHYVAPGSPSVGVDSGPGCHPAGLGRRSAGRPGPLVRPGLKSLPGARDAVQGITSAPRRTCPSSSCR